MVGCLTCGRPLPFECKCPNKSFNQKVTEYLKQKRLELETIKYIIDHNEKVELVATLDFSENGKSGLAFLYHPMVVSRFGNKFIIMFVTNNIPIGALIEYATLYDTSGNGITKKIMNLVVNKNMLPLTVSFELDPCEEVI